MEERRGPYLKPATVGKGQRKMDARDLIRAGRALLGATGCFIVYGITATLAWAAETNPQQTLVTEHPEVLGWAWKLAATAAGVLMSIAAFFVIRWINGNDKKWEEYYRWRREEADLVITVHELLHDYARRTGKKPVCLALMDEVGKEPPQDGA